MREIVQNTLIFVFFAGLAHVAYAQVGGYGIPSTYDVVGENVTGGDIISFNASRNLYEPTSVDRDPSMFGVVDITPVVVFRTGVNRLPIVQLGEVFVNVTTLNGDIEIGDKVTSSQIVGKGQKYTDGGGYILGTALQPFNDNISTSTIIVDGNEVIIGSIKVLLSIGPQINDEKSDPVTPATIFVRETGDTETGLETIFRYITAALFALGTVFVVLKTFGPNVGKGVISIGRNPLAKSSIQAMVVFNIILILAISIVSFIVSLLIIFLPI